PDNPQRSTLPPNLLRGNLRQGPEYTELAVCPHVDFAAGHSWNGELYSDVKGVAGSSLRAVVEFRGDVRRIIRVQDCRRGGALSLNDPDNPIGSPIGRNCGTSAQRTKRGGSLGGGRGRKQSPTQREKL